MCGTGAEEKGATLVDLVRENSSGCPALAITVVVERELVQLCRDFADRRHHRVWLHWQPPTSATAAPCSQHASCVRSTSRQKRRYTREE